MNPGCMRLSVSTAPGDVVADSQTESKPMTYRHDDQILCQHLVAWLYDSFERIPDADTTEDYNICERRFKAAWEALEALGENPGDYL